MEQQEDRPVAVQDPVVITLMPEHAQELADQLEDSSCQHRNWAEEHRHDGDWHTRRADVLDAIMEQLKAQGVEVDP